MVANDEAALLTAARRRAANNAAPDVHATCNEVTAAAKSLVLKNMTTFEAPGFERAGITTCSKDSAVPKDAVVSGSQREVVLDAQVQPVLEPEPTAGKQLRGEESEEGNADSVEVLPESGQQTRSALRFQPWCRAAGLRQARAKVLATAIESQMSALIADHAAVARMLCLRAGVRYNANQLQGALTDLVEAWSFDTSLVEHIQLNALAARVALEHIGISGLTALTASPQRLSLMAADDHETVSSHVGTLVPLGVLYERLDTADSDLATLLQQCLAHAEVALADAAAAAAAAAAEAAVEASKHVEAIGGRSATPSFTTTSLPTTPPREARLHCLLRRSGYIFVIVAMTDVTF